MSSQQKRKLNWISLWPNIPLKRGPTLLKNITSLGGVTKSWSSSSSSSSSSSLSQPDQLIETKGNKNPKPCVKIPFSSTNDSEDFDYYYERMQLYKKSGKGIYFKGYSHQQLVVLDANLTHCYLRGAAGEIYFLPHWSRNIPFKFATLSSSSENVMVLTGVSSPAFGFFRKDTKKFLWTMENCRVAEPNSSEQYMVFTNAIGFQGKYYAISLQGSLAVLEDKDNMCNYEITSLGRNRAVPCQVSRHFREFLVEYQGQLYLVYLISRESIDVVDAVEVLRLDIPNLSWEKVESLPDAMFFVEDKCCVGISASLVGSRGNCVYFTHDRVTTWFVFDMEKSCISPTSGPEVDLTQPHTPGLVSTIFDAYKTV